ncbi:metallophosphoesterase family protein [Celeribacter halophilus]|uniref:Metallophosphoesterase family protein n=1 Tax=Celeribacter halophilus TaxID=576117 RepID=A0AAW7Y060_9RHOB|nr:metallophosphoesterase family protein [Celeribacter halophilus]MDO6458439.1 metallophosphoesterase family protein [Celeribacter halophilus]
MFKGLFRRRQTPSEPSAPRRFEGGLPKPEETLAVVGDIHGQITCLDKLIDKLEMQTPDARWVFVGDFIDRGDYSSQVLARLRALELERPDTICILGNHEEMMLAFLRDPEQAGNRWMRHGGLQTMASFGHFKLGVQNAPEALRVARDQLLEVMPEGLEDWLASCPRWFKSGNVVVVHAGADPDRPMEEQKDQALTWGHPAFGKQAREDGLWVVHGHTVVTLPQEKNGVISVDTGAYATGKLTAVIIADGNTEFVQATA